MRFLKQDINYALRMAQRNPGSTVAAFLALTLGIGATAAMFSVVNAVLIRPLPVKDPERLVRIFESDARLAHDSVSMADYLDWQRELACFAETALYRETQGNLLGTGRPVRVRIVEADVHLLPVLGVQPFRGRNFSKTANRPGQENELLLSWELWQTHLGGGAVRGNKVLLDGKPYTVVGILPRNFDVLGSGDVWTPLSFDMSDPLNGRGFHSYMVVGRLEAGVDLKRANAELQQIAAALAKRYPKQNKGVGAAVVSLRDSLTGDIRPMLLIMLAAVGCVLLIACINVGSLLLARAATRGREMSVRIAIGASRTRLFAQLMTESLLLAGVSAIAGLAVAAVAMHAIRNVENVAVARAEEIVLDWRVSLFTVVIACGSALLFGLGPAWRGARAPVSDSLKQASATNSEPRRQHSIRKLLVCIQAALATALSIASILFLKSFKHVSEIDPGFRGDHVITTYLALPISRYGHDGDVAHFSTALLDRIRSIPGVEDAALTSNMPLVGSLGGGPIRVKGHEPSNTTWDRPYVQFTAVSPDYFHLLRIPVLQGRVFTEWDGMTSQRVAVVNESFVKRYFGGRDALGKQISEPEGEITWRDVVGVVADTRQRGLEQPPLPEIFFPISQVEERWLAVLARTKPGPSLEYVNRIRSEVEQLDPGLAIYKPRTMDEIKRQVVGRREIHSYILGAFAAVALLLASLGTYSVTAYFVARNTSIIGLHVALGATRRDVLKLVSWTGAASALGGTFSGLIAALAIGRYVSEMLYGIKALDPGTYLLVLALQVVVIVTATIVPAKQALRVAPAAALRYE